MSSTIRRPTVRVASRSPTPTSTTSRSVDSRRSRPARPTCSTRAIAISAGGADPRRPSAFFVTRPKTNMRLRATERRFVRKPNGDGFTVLEDAEVVPRQQRRFPAADPAAAHQRQARRGRARSLSSPTISSARPSTSPPSTRLAGRSSCCSAGSSSTSRSASSSATTTMPSACSCFAAMIAYLLLRIAARAELRSKCPSLRFTELVGQCIFTRRRSPPSTSRRPSTQASAQPRSSPISWSSAYA